MLLTCSTSSPELRRRRTIIRHITNQIEKKAITTDRGRRPSSTQDVKSPIKGAILKFHVQNMRIPKVGFARVDGRQARGEGQ